MYGTYGDEEYGEGEYVQAMSKEVRAGFVSKVYSILGAQLIATVLIAVPFNVYAPLESYVRVNPWMFYLALVASIGFLCAISCIPSAAREYPTNMILLGGFTICEAVLIGVITSLYTINSVMLAVGVTAVIVIGLSIYATQTETDFTGAGPYLFVALLCLMGFGFLCMFIGGPIMHKVYAALGALLFSFYLVYDTQLIVGGKHHQFSFGVDDYVFGALTLYIDIIQIFLSLLSLLGDQN